jgi:hypothetical protein
MGRKHSHLEVLGLKVGITKPCILLQQAAAQVIGVHVEVPTQQNHICLLGCVARGARSERKEFCPLSGALATLSP